MSKAETLARQIFTEGVAHDGAFILNRAELADLLAPHLAGEWQPIETAPKDGRTLLLGYHTPERGLWRTMRGQWISEQEITETWDEPDDGEEGWYETSVELDDPPNCWATNPTHWQPLPVAPPEGEQ